MKLAATEAKLVKKASSPEPQVRALEQAKAAYEQSSQQHRDRAHAVALKAQKRAKEREERERKRERERE